MTKYEFQRKKIVKFDENNIFVISGDVEDPLKAFKNACKEAENTGWKGFAWEVPKKYRENQGISLKRIQLHSMPAYIGKKRAEKFRFCCCGECSANDDGTCLRYGGPTFEFDTGNDVDCIHGTGGKLLAFCGNVIANVPVETEMSSVELARAVFFSKKETLLKSEIEEILECVPSALEKPELWGFKEDN